MCQSHVSPTSVRHDRIVTVAWAVSIVSAASVKVPIWLTLMMIAFPALILIPLFNLSVLVVNKSSPQIKQFLLFWSVLRSCQSHLHGRGLRHRQDGTSRLTPAYTQVAQRCRVFCLPFINIFFFFRLPKEKPQHLCRSRIQNPVRYRLLRRLSQ
jgi:hypothetical protein